MFLNDRKQYGLFVLLMICIGFHAGAQQCSDKAATPLTKNLYKNVYALKDTKTIFGHQDATAYGVGWKYINDRSDILAVVNDYPALYGWDLANIELDNPKNIDGIPFVNIKKYIQDSYKRGGITTISWHANNPFTGNNAWDTTHGTVLSILPGNSQHALYVSWLDKIAAFLGALKTENGEAIPILFRPFHELTGNWFWWCKNNCTPAEFIQLWNFTQDYLKNSKQLHNLIYVYNTADFSTAEGFLQRYPGDDRVDILSFDRYQYEQPNGRPQFMQAAEQQLSIITQLAKAKNKIAAIAETGYEAIPDPFWWTKTLYPLLEKYPVAYVLVWRNAGLRDNTTKMHYYAPYPGQVSAADFQLFYSLPKMVFEKKISEQKIYQ